MRKALIPAFLLLLGSVVLGATVFRDDIARATGLAQTVSATIVSPLDAQGNVKVHEQGTANVNVTNTSVPVHEQGIASVLQAGTQTTVHFSNLSLYTVPAGKRLVIVYVSGYADTSGYMVLSVQGGGAGVANFILPTQDASNEFVNRWVMSYQVTIFAGPGAQLEASAGTDAQITATGYLLDA
jgi:hypothetical protein